MTYPPGVQLATLTFSNPSTFLGNEATRTEVTVEATASVVWAATGQPIDNFEEIVSPGAGMPGQLTVPFVDQPGFTDQAGNVFSNWAYVVTRKTVYGNKMKTVRKNWQPVAGQTDVDFDNLPGGAIGLPVSAPLVSVTSVAGLTGAVGDEALAGLLAPFLPAPDVSGKLDATVAATTYAAKSVETSKLDVTALDAATAADIADPNTATATALNATFAPAAIGSAVTASRTLTAADVGKVLEVNSASDVTLTLPLHTAATIANGAELDIVQLGAGRVYIAPTAINDYPDHPEGGAGLSFTNRNSSTISVGAYGPAGAQAYRATAGTTGSYGAFGRTFSLSSLGYNPGDKISLRMWMNPSAGAPSATFTVRWKVGSGTHSESTAAYISGAGDRFVTNLTVPAGCDGVQLVVYNSGGLVGSTVDFGEIAMVKSAAPVTIVADGNDPGYFFTGTANASASMGPLIIGEQAVPVRGRAKLRQASQGTWLSTPQGTPDNVLLDSDSLLVDRDNGQAGLGTRAIAKGAGAALVANTAYARRVSLSRRMTLTSVNFMVATASGTDDPVDVGIFAASGAKMVTSGATPGRLNSTGVKSVTIATTILDPGTYYIVLAANSTASLISETFIGAAFGTAMPQAEGLTKVTSYPLPATLTGMTVADSTPTVWLREA